MKFFKYHFPFILWLLIIFIESSFPADAYPKIDVLGADKIVHLGVYGLLAALIYISMIHQEKYPYLVKNVFIITVVFCAAYGASDEFHQYFVPNRDCSFWDWLSDFAGAVIMVLLIKYYLIRKLTIFKRKELPSFAGDRIS